MSTRNSSYRDRDSLRSNGTASSSGTSTPPLSASWNVPTSVSHAVTGLLRRFSTETSRGNGSGGSSSGNGSAVSHTGYLANTTSNGIEGVYTPPYRQASPFQPPPLYPVTLKGYDGGTPETAKLLTKALAEEIRLLVPARLQLCEDWNLVYSLEEHGVSLGTLYKRCEELRGLRNGFVLVVKDGEGGLFGAYLTEAPHIEPHYFGTGECFLWRASFLSGMQMSLPPPPSSDTTNMQRSTTISGSSSLLSPTGSTSSIPPLSPVGSESIRFKAFPYSGENDYLMLCEAGYFSIGGGDGHYGLWLDDTFERGISSHCLTFGNEPLSEEGQKFDVMGVELWSIGNLPT